jgi:tetratricopeptide (TPR) repeat protein
MNNLGGTYLDAGRAQEAVTLFEPALEKYKATLGPDHPDTLRAVSNLGKAYLDAGRAQDAVTLLEPAQEKYKATLGPDHPATLVSRDILAYSYEAAGKLDQEERLLQDRLKQQRKQEGSKSEVIAGVLARLGLNLLKQGRSAEAEPILRECLAIRDQTLPDGWLRFNAMSMLGGALLDQKDAAAAEPLVMRGYEEMKRREATMPPFAKQRLTEAAERIGHFYEVSDQPEKARRWREQHSTNESGRAGKS